VTLNMSNTRVADVFLASLSGAIEVSALAAIPRVGLDGSTAEHGISEEVSS